MLGSHRKRIDRRTDIGNLVGLCLSPYIVSFNLQSFRVVDVDLILIKNIVSRVIFIAHECFIVVKVPVDRSITSFGVDKLLEKHVVIQHVDNERFMLAFFNEHDVVVKRFLTSCFHCHYWDMISMSRLNLVTEVTFFDVVS